MVKQLLSKLLLLAVVLLGSSLTVIAQSGVVTGTVTDALDGASLPGATIVVKGSTSGTVTDIDGKFSIEVTPNQVLVFSYVGYSPQEHIVQPGTTLDVVLESSALSLDGVVIIGYGSVKKKDATGSVAVVGEDDFNKGAITNPVGLISGKVAGVQITSNSGAPGEAATIRIRGGSSLKANNDPLVVIDGAITSGNGGSGSRNALNSLNPADIESFTVLKDASATAIYGSRASNGVILITTKKGKSNMPLKLEYNGKLSFYEKPKPLGVLSSDEFVSLFTERNPNYTQMLGVWYDTDGHQVAGNDADSTSTHKIYNTNWQDEIYQSAFAMDHALSATGSVKDWMPYRFSIGYTDQDGTLKTSEFQRTTVSVALNPTLLDDHLKLNINASGSIIKNRFANRGAIGAAVQMDPTKPVYSQDGAWDGYYAWLGNGGGLNSMATSNPVSLLQQRIDKSNVNRIYGNFQADYKFHFLPELRANLNLALDHTDNDGTVYVPNTAAWSYDNVKGGGENNGYTSKNKNDLLDFYLNYKKELSSISSVFDVMAGYSWQHFWYENTWDNKNIPIYVDPDTGDSTGQYLDQNTGIDKQELFLISFFGRLNYTFKNRYLFTATFRQDGSSRFSKDNRWGLFPAVALGWKINEESFLRDSKTISELKLRLGWGRTGQQDVGNNYYGYQGRYTYGNQYSMYPFGNTYYNVIRPEGYNPSQKWETTTTYNIGLDYGFFNDRLYGSIEAYKRVTTDLFIFAPVPAGTNLTNEIDQNVGDLENTGIEFAINGRIISNEDMFWELGFNATYNKNEITKLYEGASLETGGISGGVGNTIQVHAVGHPASSYYVYEQVYDEDGMPIQGLYIDRNEDGIINADDKYIHESPNAPLYFGVTNTFNYKSWSFYFAGRANFGNYVYNNSQSELATYDRLYRDEGPYAGNVLASVHEVGFSIPQYHSDYFVQEASFFRMDDITLSYTFENLLKNSLNIRLSATCNNAFVITNYKGLDPEVFGGIDNNLYPRSRVWVFGVNLQF